MPRKPERIDPKAPQETEPVTFCDGCHKLERTQQVKLPRLRVGWYCLRCQRAARGEEVSHAA